MACEKHCQRDGNFIKTSPSIIVTGGAHLPSSAHPEAFIPCEDKRTVTLVCFAFLDTAWPCIADITDGHTNQDHNNVLTAVISADEENTRPGNSESP